MRNYIRDVLIPKRKEALKREPNKQDVVSRLLQTEFTKDTEFDEERIVSNVAGFVVGSIETMNNTICKMMNQLLNKPEAMAMAQKAVDVDDDDEITRICWEALRFDVPPFLKRIVSEDCSINGRHFEKGTIVLLSQRSAFMDPEWIENPAAFNPHRKFAPDHTMFHFGHGIHTCLGRDVAKIAVPMVIKEIILHGNGIISRVEGPAGVMKFDQNGDYVESLKVKLGSEKTKDMTWMTSLSMITYYLVLFMNVIESVLDQANKIIIGPKMIGNLSTFLLMQFGFIFTLVLLSVLVASDAVLPLSTETYINIRQSC